MEEPRNVAQDMVYPWVQLAVDSHRELRCSRLLEQGPTPPYTNSTVSRQKALGTCNSEVIMGLVEFLPLLLSSYIPRHIVELS